MEARPFIEQLEKFHDRYAGGLGERASQEAMAGLFRRLGYRARVEGCVCHTNPAFIWLAHAFLMVVGGLLAAIHPIPGLIVTGLALLSWIGEAVYRFRLVRWFVPKGISSNLIARMEHARERDVPRILYVAHGDVARRGLIHNGLLGRAFRGAMGRAKTHPMNIVLVVAWIQLALVCLRFFNVYIELLDKLLLVPLAFFVLLVLLSLDWMRPRPAAGANDNGSGLAVVAALAEYFTDNPPRHAEICFLVTGSREADCGGADAFFTIFGRTLPARSTMVINIDDVGAGRLCFATAEKVPAHVAYHPLLPGMAALLSRQPVFRKLRPVTLIGRSDAGVATRYRYPSITIKGLHRGRPATPVHTARDRIRLLDPTVTAKAFGFARALAERIDEEFAREPRGDHERERRRRRPGESVEVAG